jgi:carboxyl-terminal processing protease
MDDDNPHHRIPDKFTMKTLTLRRTLLLLAFFALLAGIAVLNTGVEKSTAQDSAAPLLPLTPQVAERSTAQVFIDYLEKQHISKRTIDQPVSQEAFRLYITSLDPRKLYFYQSDIDEFKSKYELAFGELAKRGEVRPAFEIYNRYLGRLK